MKAADKCTECVICARVCSSETVEGLFHSHSTCACPAVEEFATSTESCANSELRLGSENTDPEYEGSPDVAECISG